MGEREPPFDPAENGSESEARAEVVNPASPMTFEGVIEGYGKLAGTARRGSGWRRTVAYVVALAILAPLALGILVALGMALVSAVKSL